MEVVDIINSLNKPTNASVDDLMAYEQVENSVVNNANK
jgi:hypothetical protein